MHIKKIEQIIWKHLYFLSCHHLPSPLVYCGQRHHAELELNLEKLWKDAQGNRPEVGQ